MIDLKKLEEQSKFLNLKQVCDSAGVNYNNVAQKVKRFRDGSNSKLNKKEALNITRKLKNLAVTFHQL